MYSVKMIDVLRTATFEKINPHIYTVSKMKNNRATMN